MNENHEALCECIDQYLDDELDQTARTEFERHLNVCPDCQAYLEAYNHLLQTLDQCARGVTLPDDVDLKIRHEILRELGQSQHPSQIMDIEELARFLAMPVPEIVKLLDQLPSFELGGRIRFRRDRIIAWLEERERKMSWERDQANFQTKQKLIRFPGGQ
ncbi:zf-HC2 domain-containing protein [bacterium]|nr:zf-HC2 domain-containing protein [bacterium]